MPKPTTIDGYLATVQPDQRAALQRLRATIRAAAPDAEECISYGLAAFRLGRLLVGFGAKGKHCAFYLMSDQTLRAHRDELAGRDVGKGTIRFQPHAPLPAPLVRKLVRARVAENGALAPAPEPRYFASAAAFRRWLAAHHAAASELLVGFHKRGTDEASMTWQQAVDEVLCVGWVDGVRKRVDASRYTIRFTPRRAGSTWSAVNIARVAALRAAGRLAAAGEAAFARRSAKKSRTYSYEKTSAVQLDESLQQLLDAAPGAAAFHRAQAPSYRRKCVHWIMSAKAAPTRLRRLRQLMAAYAQGRRL